MTALPSACYPPAHNQKPEVDRPMVHFRPGFNSNHFINYTPDDEGILARSQELVEDLKEQVRREIMAAAGTPSQQLSFIDAIQRLGVAYHFEEEIEKELRHIYDNCHQGGDKDDDDLYYVSLRFRLLRQQGYSISCDIFKKFKEQNGCFKESLVRDVRGMLALYEASFLRVHEEDILDEVLAFTKTHLACLVKHLHDPLASQVNRALNQSIRKRLERLDARQYISIYKDEATRSEALLKLAQLDFNLLQSLYKKELSQIASWWKDLDLPSKLPFVRDRVVESYVWIFAATFKPQYSYARRIQTKLLVIITVIDDFFDAYGTPEELELFTKAVDRWDSDCIDMLPEYMKLCYQALLDAYKEIEEKENADRPYIVHYAKEAMKGAVQAYPNEAKWYHRTYVPTVEEYLNVALATSCVTLFTTICFVGMGRMATKEVFDWVLKDPIMRATSMILRLMDDTASHKFEQERGHGASSVECYMKQHSVSEERAYQDLSKEVENGWKEVNQGCLRPTAIPMHLLSRVLNFARSADFIYGGRHDLFTNVGEKMKNIVASLFVDPMPT